MPGTPPDTKTSSTSSATATAASSNSPAPVSDAKDSLQASARPAATVVAPFPATYTAQDYLTDPKKFKGRIAELVKAKQFELIEQFIKSFSGNEIKVFETAILEHDLYTQLAIIAY